MKRLFLIESLLEYRIFLNEYFPRGDDFVIICENATVQALLLKKGIFFKTKIDYLTHDELNEINRISIRHMDSWFYYKDFSLYKNIHLCSLYSMDYGLIERIILYIEKIIKAIQKDRPQKIIVSESYQSLTEHIIRVHTSENVVCEGYKLNPFGKIICRIINNPYYRYVKRGNVRTMINEIRDYIFPLPREFKIKGKGIHDIKKGPVIITAVHKNEVQVSANPANELRERGIGFIFFVIDCDGGEVLKNIEAKGFKYIRPGDLFNQGYKRLYEEFCKQFENRWVKISNDPGFWVSLLYKGIPVLKYTNREKLRWMVTKLSPFWAVIYEMLFELFKGISVKAVIALNDAIILGRVAAYAADRLSIPSIDIQHGVFIDTPAMAVANKWCLWSETDKYLLIEKGIPACKLVVTGNPSFDNLISAKYNADAIKMKIGISNQYKTVITWAPSAEWFFYYSEENYNERIFAALQEIAREYREIMFIFKPHPSERLNRFKRILDTSLLNMVIIDPDQNSYEIFYISDIIMSWNSSVITEAVILDKPIIGLNFFGQGEKVRCVSEGIAIEVRTIEELEQAINDIMLNKKNVADCMKDARYGYLEKFFYKVDGRSSSRIVDVLEDFMTHPL